MTLTDEQIQCFIDNAVNSSLTEDEVIDAVNYELKSNLTYLDITSEDWRKIENFTILCGDCGWWAEAGIISCQVGHDRTECELLDSDDED